MFTGGGHVVNKCRETLYVQFEIIKTRDANISESVYSAINSGDDYKVI
jgi:hypothetical protein